MVALPNANLVPWADLDPLDTTTVNAYLRDPVRFALGVPIARLLPSIVQVLLTSTWTDIVLGVETVDTDIDGVGGHSTSSNTARFTARYPGWYGFTGGVAFVSNATGVRASRWAKNGTAVDSTENIVSAISGIATPCEVWPLQINLNAGDYITLQGWQSSGGNLNLSTGPAGSVMQVTWLRALVGDI